MISHKRKLSMNAFFTSHFSCFSLTWMYHSRSNNRKISMFHERCLKIIYNEKQSSFTELLNKDNYFSVHIKNIQRLAIEIFCFYNGLSPPLMKNMFNLSTENLYNVRHSSEISRSMINSVCHGTKSISFLGPKYGI